MRLTPKLISECKPNCNFSANREGNKNVQDNENHPGKENEGNCQANKFMFKVNNTKNLLVSL